MISPSEKVKNIRGLALEAGHRAPDRRKGSRRAGVYLRSAARRPGIIHETARVPARSVFSRVGVSHQVDLVRALARLR